MVQSLIQLTAVQSFDTVAQFAFTELFLTCYKVLKMHKQRVVYTERELGVVVSDLGLQSKGPGFKSCLFQILHGNSVIAMPGSIPIVPNPGS